MSIKKRVMISYEDFLDRYKPVDNFIVKAKSPGVEEYCGWNNKYFETFGEEDSEVRRVLGESPRKVWTIIETDSDEEPFIIQSGYHHVNRFGHLITEVEFDEGEDIEVHVD